MDKEKSDPPPPYEPGNYNTQYGVSPGQQVGTYPYQFAGYQQQGTGYPPAGFHPEGAWNSSGVNQSTSPPQQVGSYPQSGTGYPPAGFQQHGAGNQGGLNPTILQHGTPGPYGQQGYLPQGYGPPHVQQTTQAVIVHQPGAAGHVIYQTRPRNYMVVSILACLFCFCPTGSLAIYFAHKANQNANEGNMAEALTSSNTARNLVIVSVVIGLVWIAAVVVRVVLYWQYYNY